MDHNNFEKILFEKIQGLSSNKYNSTICYQQIIKTIKSITDDLKTFDSFVPDIDKHYGLLNSCTGGLFLRVLTNNGYENVTHFLKDVIRETEISNRIILCGQYENLDFPVADVINDF